MATTTTRTSTPGLIHVAPQVILALAAICSATVLAAMHDIDGSTAIAVVLAALGITSGGTVAATSTAVGKAHSETTTTTAE